PRPTLDPPTLPSTTLFRSHLVPDPCQGRIAGPHELLVLGIGADRHEPAQVQVLTPSHQGGQVTRLVRCDPGLGPLGGGVHLDEQDRKSTRLNSSHVSISYA